MLKSLVSTFQTAVKRSSSLSEQQAVEILHQWQSTKKDALIFDSDRREITLFIQAIDTIQQSPNNAKEFHNLKSKSMARLINEFIVVLSRQSMPSLHQPVPNTAVTEYWSTVTDSTGYTVRYEDFKPGELPSEVVIDYLRTVAERMSFSGEIGECFRVYKSVREPFLRSQLRQIRFDEVAMVDKIGRFTWDELIVKIKVWTEVFKICVMTLFVKEKRICEQIFNGVGEDDTAADKCFVLTVQEIAANLFSFADSMSSSSLSYDRIGDVLGLYDAFVSVLPDIETLFACDLGRKVRDKSADISYKTGNHVVRMLHNFEKDLLLEDPIQSDERGAIHETTRFVVKKISEIARYRELLARLINSAPSLQFDDKIVNPQETFQDYPYLSFLEQHLILIVEILQVNLKNKCESYPHASLAELFTMNNIRYVIQKIETTNELQEIIGDSYARVLNEKVKSAADSYQESTCKKFLTCFDDKGLYTTRFFKHLVSKSAVRKRLKAFNTAFEEVRSLQSLWVISDLRIRNEVRVSMSGRLVPAYKNFLAKFTSSNDKMRKMLEQKKIEHSPEEFEAFISQELFAESDAYAS